MPPRPDSAELLGQPFLTASELGSILGVGPDQARRLINANGWGVRISPRRILVPSKVITEMIERVAAARER